MKLKIFPVLLFLAFLAGCVSQVAKTGEWHTLRVSITGNKGSVYLMRNGSIELFSKENSGASGFIIDMDSSKEEGISPAVFSREVVDGVEYVTCHRQLTADVYVAERANDGSINKAGKVGRYRCDFLEGMPPRSNKPNGA